MQSLIQHFTPLNLHLDDTQQATQFDKPDEAKRLRENVCQLLLRAHMIHIHLTSLDAGSGEVKLHVNVLTAIMKYWILAQSDR